MAAGGGATSPDDMHVSRDGTEDPTAVQQQGNNGDQLQDDLDETGSAKGKSVIIVREKAKRGARAVSHHPLHTRARQLTPSSCQCRRPQCVSCRRLKKTVRLRTERLVDGAQLIPCILCSAKEGLPPASGANRTGPTACSTSPLRASSKMRESPFLRVTVLSAHGVLS